MSDMKLIMENWRKFSLNEEGDGDGDGISYEKEVEALKKVYKIVAALDDPDIDRSGRNRWGPTGLGNVDDDVKVWHQDLLTLLEDRISRVASGNLGKPPSERTTISIRRMIGRLKKKFSRFLAAAAQFQAPGFTAAADIYDELSESLGKHTLEEADIPDEDRRFKRAKRRLIHALERLLRGAEDRLRDEAHSEAFEPKYQRVLKAFEDLESMDNMEDILNDAEHVAQVFSDYDYQDIRADDLEDAFDSFQNQAAGTGRYDEDLLGTLSQVLRRAINILRSPLLEKVYLEDLQELLFDLYVATSADDRFLSAEFE